MVPHEQAKIARQSRIRFGALICTEPTCQREFESQTGLVKHFHTHLRDNQRNGLPRFLSRYGRFECTRCHVHTTATRGADHATLGLAKCCDTGRSEPENDGPVDHSNGPGGEDTEGDDDDFSFNIDAVSTAAVPTIVDLPCHLVEDVATEICRLMARVVDDSVAWWPLDADSPDPTLEGDVITAWANFLAFFPCVMRKTKQVRGGARRKRRNRMRDLPHRLQLWQKNRRQTLWEDALRIARRFRDDNNRARKASNRSSPHDSVRRATKLAMLEEYSRALRALTQQTSRSGPDAANALRQQFPAPDEQVGGGPTMPIPAPLQISATERTSLWTTNLKHMTSHVWKGLAKTKRGVSPGDIGIRYEHLKVGYKLRDGPGRDAYKEALCGLIRLLHEARVPAAVLKVLHSTHLAALDKDPSHPELLKLRPISVVGTLTSLRERLRCGH